MNQDEYFLYESSNDRRVKKTANLTPTLRKWLEDYDKAVIESERIRKTIDQEVTNKGLYKNDWWCCTEQYGKHSVSCEHYQPEIDKEIQR